ncbi:hypothetical protein RUM43_010026 [Polyplax serrata]|uniref:Uncharacterized protein n=1 Tax=Polyplax serrata TaxID=468196 RepID=A0AAN8PK10_POLSC
MRTRERRHGSSGCPGCLMVNLKRRQMEADDDDDYGDDEEEEEEEEDILMASSSMFALSVRSSPSTGTASLSRKQKKFGEIVIPRCYFHPFWVDSCDFDGGGGDDGGTSPAHIRERSCNTHTNRQEYDLTSVVTPANQSKKKITTESEFSVGCSAFSSNLPVAVVGDVCSTSANNMLQHADMALHQFDVSEGKVQSSVTFRHGFLVSGTQI